MKPFDYNLKYFDFIRDEITKRIQIHYRLVLTRIAIVGGTLAFLWKSPSEITGSRFLIPSIVAFLLDIIILENLGWIRSAGAYVRENIENSKRNDIINWENDFAQKGGQWACFHWAGYLLGIWIIGFALQMAHVYVWHSLNQCTKLDVPLFAISCYLAAYTVFLVWYNLGRKEPPMRSGERSSPVESA